MKGPTDLYGVPLEVGQAVRSTAVNLTGQIAEIIPPGPALVTGAATDVPQRQPGKIVLLFEVHLLYDEKTPAMQTLLALATQQVLDWQRVAKTKSTLQN